MLVLAWLLLALAGAPTIGAELVMFRSDACEWCEVWEEEVGVIYAKTPESRLAALRRVDIEDPRPADLPGLKPVVYTPTFVLVEEGAEIGRIVGYPGEAFFWGLLDVLLQRLATER